MIVAPGTTSNILTIQIVDDNGLAVTGLVAATFPSLFYSLATNIASTAITPLSDLAAITTAFTAKGVKEREAGYYRVDVPDAAFTTAGTVRIEGEASGKHVICEPIIVANLPANVTQINAVATTSVTTVNANIGTTQAITFDANNLQKVDVEDWKANAVPATNVNGVPLIDAKYLLGTVISTPTTAGIMDINVLNWHGGAVPAPNVTGVPLVDAKYLLGTIFVTPATAGIMDVNAKNINNVSTSSVTTINANQGTTQPVNFSGTGATAYVKSDVEQWVTVAPNALAQGKIDATDNVRNGTAQAGAAGTITLDSGASATDQFYRGMKITIVSGTGTGQGSRLIGGYTGSTKVASVVPNWTTTPDSTSVFIISTWCGTDVELWELVTPNALISGRVDASVGAMASNVITASAINAAALNGKGDWLVSSSYPSNFGSLAITAGGIVQSDLQTVLTHVVTVDANNVLNVSTKYVGGTLQTAGDIPGRLPAALSGSGNMKSDIEEIAGNTGGASRLDRSARAIATGSVGTGSTATNIVVSSITPAMVVASQFIGRIVIFDKDTTTANLRGQATNITANDAAGNITVTALTTAAVSGDTFTIT